MLGVCYDRGLGTPVDRKAAEDAWRDSIRLGSSQAMLDLARFLASNGVRRDDREAERLLEWAVNRGYAPAMVELGDWLLEGRRTEGNRVRAVELYEKAAERGYAPAMVQLAECYDLGLHGVPANERAAHRWYAKAAEQGNAVAINNVGVYHARGKAGLSKSEPEALACFVRAGAGGLAIGWTNAAATAYAGANRAKSGPQILDWLSKASALGSVPAARWRAQLLLEGELGPKDPEQALTLMESIASDAPSKLELASVLSSGKYLPPQPERARRWCRAAADAGSARAAFVLSDWIKKGYGGPSDATESTTWLRTAGRLGDPDALVELARAELSSDTGNPATAFAYLERAAFRGRSDVFRSLGAMCYQGLGTRKDDRAALAYFRRGAEAGDAESMYSLWSVANASTATDVADVTDAEDWLRRSAEKGHVGAKTALARLEQARRDQFAAAKRRREAQEFADGFLKAAILVGGAALLASAFSGGGFEGGDGEMDDASQQQAFLRNQRVFRLRSEWESARQNQDDPRAESLRHELNSLGEYTGGL